ncbi:hypothetical protein [Halorussus halophilus]|uniref:hypothetical protein n=1 Tax=Halorussus halophilus TaxID=2650975 RepID=UPI001300DAAF|nr:hypothetical protein [Halorussus halophilus]
MATKHLHFLAIQVVLFGGFLWLEPNYSMPGGFWIMVFGLLLGVAALVIEVGSQFAENGTN